MNYKEFYNFIKLLNPQLIKLWNEFNNREDPKEGDLFSIMQPVDDGDCYNLKTGRFIKVEFDSKFKNGVAFYYLFNCNNEIVKIHSIHSVDDPDKITEKEYKDLYGFWTLCEPLKFDEYDML